MDFDLSQLSMAAAESASQTFEKTRTWTVLVRLPSVPVNDAVAFSTRSWNVITVQSQPEDVVAHDVPYTLHDSHSGKSVDTNVMPFQRAHGGRTGSHSDAAIEFNVSVAATSIRTQSFLLKCHV